MCPSPIAMPAPARCCASSAACCRRDMVVKFWPHNLHFSPGYTEALQDIGVEVAYGGDADTFRQWLADNGDDLDHVLLCRPQVAAAFLPELKRARRDQPAVLRRRPALQPHAPGGEGAGRPLHRAAGGCHGDAGALRLARCGCGAVSVGRGDRDRARPPSRTSSRARCCRTALPISPRRGRRPPNRSSCSSAASRISRTVTACSGSSIRCCR